MLVNGASSFPSTQVQSGQIHLQKVLGACVSFRHGTLLPRSLFLYVSWRHGYSSEQDGRGFIAI